MSDCVFCRIVSGEIPSSKVFEDPHVLAFRDINPVAPIHILVIPKQHVASVVDPGASPTMFSHLMSAVQTIARQESIDSFRLISNTGAESGQAVFHLHFHIIGGRALDKLV